MALEPPVLVEPFDDVNDFAVSAQHPLRVARSLLLASFSAPIGAMLRVRLTHSTAGAAQTGANTIALGVDLIGRPA